MTNGRPYLQLSLEGLRAKVSDSLGSQSVLDEVRQELALRTTLGAKRLMREVEALMADAVTAKSTEKLSVIKKPASSTVEREAKVAISNIESRYSALRATFTAEAEILARWGLTSLAPPTVRDAVFSFWRETLIDPSGQHPLGLSREDLERDIEALVSEKREA